MAEGDVAEHQGFGGRRPRRRRRTLGRRGGGPAQFVIQSKDRVERRQAVQGLLGALLQGHRRRIHARQQEQQGDQDRGVEVEHHDPGEEGRRGHERRGRGGQVGEPRLVTEELQLIARGARRGRLVLLDELALQPLGRRELQPAQEHQGAVGHAHLGSDDRRPQAPGALQMAVAEQNGGEGAGDGQQARQRRQGHGEGAVAEQHHHGHGPAHRRIGSVADLAQLDAQGLDDPDMLEPDDVLPWRRRQMVDQAQADRLDELQPQPVDRPVAGGEHQASGRHQENEEAEQGEQPLGPAIALERRQQRPGKSSTDPSPAVRRGDHVQHGDQHQKARALEHRAQGHQQRRGRRPPAGKPDERLQEGERAGADARLGHLGMRLRPRPRKVDAPGEPQGLAPGKNRRREVQKV